MLEQDDWWSKENGEIGKMDGWELEHWDKGRMTETIGGVKPKALGEREGDDIGI